VQRERRGASHERQGHLESPKSVLHTVGVCGHWRGIPRRPDGDSARDQKGKREEGPGVLYRRGGVEKWLGFGEGRGNGWPGRAPCGERALTELGDDM
jgi:hypothetical protein